MPSSAKITPPVNINPTKITDKDYLCLYCNLVLVWEKHFKTNKKDNVTGKRVIRPTEAMKRLGVGETHFWTKIARKRLRMVRLGDRALGVIESDLDALIESMLEQDVA